MTQLLNHFSSGTEPGTERFLLVQGCNPITQSAYRGQVPRIEARVVRAASIMDGVSRGQTDSQGYRWASWSSSKATAVCVDNLVLSCDIDVPGTRDLYLQWFNAQFEALGTSPTIDLRAANRYVRTLAKLDKRLSVQQRSGTALQFAIYLKEAMTVLGVKGGALFYQNDEVRGDLDDAGKFYTVAPTSTKRLIEGIRDIASAITVCAAERTSR